VRAGELVLLVRQGEAVRLVDLAPRAAVAAGADHIDPVVTRDRETDRLLPAGEDVDEDQRVRRIAAHAADVHGVFQALGQRLAGPVGTALQPHQQDVHRSDRWAAHRRRDDLRAADAGDLAFYVVGEAAGDQDQGGGDASQGVSGLACDRSPPAGPEHPVCLTSDWLTTAAKSTWSN